MEGIDGIVACRNEKGVTDDKINFLLARLMSVAKRREVEHKICVAWIEFQAWFCGRQEKLFGNEGRNIELARNILNFGAVW